MQRICSTNKVNYKAGFRNIAPLIRKVKITEFILPKTLYNHSDDPNFHFIMTNNPHNNREKNEQL